MHGSYHRTHSWNSLAAFVGGAIVWALFGEKIKSRVSESKLWQDMKREVTDEALRIKNLTQDGYNRIVDEVADKYSRVKGISRHELTDLVDDLKVHWDR